MRLRLLLVCAVALVATLFFPMLASAAADAQSHESRISELEKKVRRLEALLEAQSLQVEACARAEEQLEAALESCPSVEEVEEQVEVALAETIDYPTLYNETDIKVGGYVKVDAIISDYSNASTRGVGEDFFIPETLQTSGEAGDPRLNLHAKETRFWLKSFTPTEKGNVNTHFEIDFLAGQQGNERVGNSFSPRIRHASLSWDRWLVGQTWTNFFNVATLPDYLDFIGPVGTIFARQAQIRYTLPAANGDWAFSLENPETTLTPFGGGSRIDADDGSYPDVVVRRNWNGDWGTFSVAALLRELKIEEGGSSDAEFGAAIGLAGKFMVGGRDDFRWQLNFGTALGRYMGINAFNVGALDADGSIELTSQFGIVTAYRHVWSDQLHSSFGASFASADNDTAISGLEVPESYQSAHADIVWSPVERMSIGAEYIWGRRKDESGADGMLNRLQLSAKYIY